MARAVQGSAEIHLHADLEQFRALLGKSSQVDRKLKTALRRNIRNAAKEPAAAAKSAALAPGRTVGKRPVDKGLRQGIASGIRVQVMTGTARSGVRIVSSGFLGRAWDNPQGWRHPVFDHKAAPVSRWRSKRAHGVGLLWVKQQGSPYFATVIPRYAPKVTEAVRAAMREAVEGL